MFQRKSGIVALSRIQTWTPPFLSTYELSSPGLNQVTKLQLLALRQKIRTVLQSVFFRIFYLQFNPLQSVLDLRSRKASKCGNSIANQKAGNIIFESLLGARFKINASHHMKTISQVRCNVFSLFHLSMYGQNLYMRYIFQAEKAAQVLFLSFR